MGRPSSQSQKERMCTRKEKKQQQEENNCSVNQTSS